MIPTMATVLKTIAGKTILGVVVVTMGVGAAAAAGADVPLLSASDRPDEELADDDDGIDDDDINDDDGIDDDGTDDDGTDDDGIDDDGIDDDGIDDDGIDDDGIDDDGTDDDGTDDASESARGADPEVEEWKVVKTEGRDGWHDLRDQNQAEWLEAKAAFNELCGDDDDESGESVEGDDLGTADDDAEMTPECQALKDELKVLKDEGKSEWKQARDDAKAAWMAVKNEAKADARAERDEAKAARIEARAERSNGKPGKKDK